MKYPYSILPESIVVTVDGTFHNVPVGDARYEDLKQALIDDDDDAVVEAVRKTVAVFEDAGCDIRDGQLFIDDELMNDGLADKILQFAEAKLPTDRLVKLARRIKNNPSYNSRIQLYKFLEHNGHPITEDGCFIAYRGVTADFKDKYTKSFDNSVGAVCDMPRELVDDNPNNTCSQGLHVACHSYADGWGDTVVEVKVAPEDVVCVPTDYDGTKMRVCEFKVVAVNKLGELDTPIYDCEDEDDDAFNFSTTNGDMDFAHPTSDILIWMPISTVISKVIYNCKEHTATVQLDHGKYYYYKINHEEFQDWLSWDSAGSWWNRYLKGGEV
jgi:hypothetical protein